MKDFNSWNDKKKLTDNRKVNFNVNEREVWWTSLGLNIGVEANGKNDEFERPVLVLKKFNKDMVWVLPITSQSKSNLFHEDFIFRDDTYYIAITQIRTLSTKRFLRKSGMISKSDFERMRKRVASFLWVNEDPLQSGSSRRPKP